MVINHNKTFFIVYDKYGSMILSIFLFFKNIRLFKELYELCMGMYSSFLSHSIMMIRKRKNNL